MKPASEVDIRNQLKRDLRATKWSWVAERRKLYVPEMDLGSSRADLMMVTPGAHSGFEIKSGRDRLDKLAHQVPAYELYCDYCWLVLDEKHPVVELPDYWGVIRAFTREDGSVDLSVVRPATLNPTDPDKRLLRIAGHLWSNELKAALKAQKKRGYSKNRKYKNVRWLCQSPAAVRPMVYQFMRARGNWREARRGTFMQ